MKRLNRSSALPTALIAVFSTLSCPAVRGGPILFTTTFIASDSQQGKETFGPLAGNYPWVVRFDGDAYVPAWGISVPYASDVESSSEFDGHLFPSGEIQVGALASEGVLEGDDNLKVKGEVDFSMTIQAAANAPAAPSIPILFFPTLSGTCKNESWPAGYPPGSSTCNAEASASITDNITGASQAATLPIVSGTGKATIYPALMVNASAGDTFSIDLTTVIDMGGGVAACGSPGNFELCGTLGSEAFAAVDPLFEFDQQYFNQEMGANAFNLSDYYSLSFSPNIPIAPISTPEPSSLLLLGAGAAGIGLAALRRRSRRRSCPPG